MGKSNTCGQTGVWLARAGSKSEAHLLFLGCNVIALGPPQLGDLTHADATRDAFKSLCRTAFPDANYSSIGGVAGQLYRFVHEVQSNDLVIYPSKKDGRLHIGRFSGHYKFDQSHDARFPHQRPIRWLDDVARTEIGEELQKESRAFKSFYAIRSCAAEVFDLAAKIESH